MTGDERTCAEVARRELLAYGVGVVPRVASGTLAAIHPDLPDMPATTLRRYITLGQWVDSERSLTLRVSWQGDADLPTYLRTIGAES